MTQIHSHNATHNLKVFAAKRVSHLERVEQLGRVSLTFIRPRCWYILKSDNPFRLAYDIIISIVFAEWHERKSWPLNTYKVCELGFCQIFAIF